MHRIFIGNAVVFFISWMPFSVWPDLPLTIEDLLTVKGRYRIDTNFVFADTSQRRNTSTSQTIQTGSGGIVQIPVSLGESTHNADIFVATLGFRYGLGINSEIYTRITDVTSTVRTESVNGLASDSNHAIANWIAGVNHRFSDDNDTPALLGFMEVNLLENKSRNKSDYIHGKTWQIGFTIYRSIDPIVLSMTGAYRYSKQRVVDGQRVDPGDLLWINPSLAFAVNNIITLTGGVHLRFEKGQHVNGKVKSIDNSQTRLEFGLGYSASKQLTLRFDVRTDISGDDGSEIGLNLVYKFYGKLGRNETTNPR